MSTNPFKELASLMDRRSSKRMGELLSGVPCELGTITATGLKLDNFKHEVQDYLIADWRVKLHLPAFFFVGTSTSPVDAAGNPLPGAVTSDLTKYSMSEKEIDQVWLELKPDLAPGDRVLVIPVNGDQDLIVVCKVVSNSA